MAKREQVQKPAPQERKEEPAVEAKGRAPEVQQTLDYTDDLLDEIDGLLEENAEAFIDNFVQHGGE